MLLILIYFCCLGFLSAAFMKVPSNLKNPFAFTNHFSDPNSETLNSFQKAAYNM